VAETAPKTKAGEELTALTDEIIRRLSHG
jgi:hypothetical protein